MSIVFVLIIGSAVFLVGLVLLHTTRYRILCLYFPPKQTDNVFVVFASQWSKDPLSYAFAVKTVKSEVFRTSLAS